MATIANMTPDELKQFIENTIDERLTRLLGDLAVSESEAGTHELAWKDIRALVKQHRWTPPPGAKSSQAFLREDRDG